MKNKAFYLVETTLNKMFCLIMIKKNHFLMWQTLDQVHKINKEELLTLDKVNI